MLPVYSGWDIIYGKAVFSESLIKAVSRGLLLCLRSAVDVEMPPSLQHLCLLGLLETSLGGQAQSASTEPSEVVAPKEKKARVSSPASLSRNIGCKSGHRRRHYPGFCNKSRGMDGGRQGQTQDALVQDGCREEKGGLGCQQCHRGR